MNTEIGVLPHANDAARSPRIRTITARFDRSALYSALLPNKRIRRKHHLVWEEAERASGGHYTHILEDLAHHFPQLSPMELRVSALVKELLPSWRIAEILCITEKAVENYRVKIRRKIGCGTERLTEYFARI